MFTYYFITFILIYFYVIHSFLFVFLLIYIFLLILFLYIDKYMYLHDRPVSPSGECVWKRA